MWNITETLHYALNIKRIPIMISNIHVSLAVLQKAKYAQDLVWDQVSSAFCPQV